MRTWVNIPQNTVEKSYLFNGQRANAPAKEYDKKAQRHKALHWGPPLENPTGSAREPREAQDSPTPPPLTRVPSAPRRGILPRIWRPQWAKDPSPPAEQCKILKGSPNTRPTSTSPTPSSQDSTSSNEQTIYDWDIAKPVYWHKVKS